ncbi:PRC-barrel domain-containing protein [Desulforamulus ferrireducens]|uniref:Photosystem reaction center subunit H n=1 Tax=Desulforamulus ferrireducens TaxID=1833852 RepID=A0A1S6ISW7_9FIRM|nr:PRC-barrel domain-containing protein [Desulforamulus ferrireducens]AQS57860.1 photosystem reaction center subunit H [Desulforamulus ferrireducens]
MRKSKKFIGMPVISLAEGQQLGTVKGLVVDPAEQKVAALIIEQKGWFKEQKFVPYSKVRSVGADAITIDQSAAVEKAASLPEILKLYKDKITVINCKVLAENGSQLGVVDEYYVDEFNGNIVGLELSGTLLNSLMKGKSFLDISFVKTIGKELIVTSNDAAENLVKSDGGLQDTVKHLRDSTSQLWDSTLQITKELGTKTKELSIKTVEGLESKTKDLGHITKDLGENLLEKVRGKNKAEGIEDVVSVQEMPESKLKRQEDHSQPEDSPQEDLTRQPIEDSVQVVDLPPQALKRQEEEQFEENNSETTKDLNPGNEKAEPTEQDNKKE